MTGDDGTAPAAPPPREGRPTAARTLLLGYADKGNFGDDVMIDAIRAAMGAEVPLVIGGRVPLARLARLLWRARRIVVCGGHVIDRRTGSYQRVLALARLMGVRRVFYSIEVSGWPPGRAGWLQRWIMRGAAISVRTAGSAAILARALPGAPVETVVDAFYLHPDFAASPPPGQVLRHGRLQWRAGPATAPPTEIVVLPRSFPEGGPYPEARNLARLVAEVDAQVARAGPLPVRVAPSAAVDRTGPAAAALRAAGHTVEELGADDTLALTPRSLVVTNRLHIAKACVFFGLPNTLISYDRKTEAPELVGTTGDIVQLDGSRLSVADLAGDAGDFAVRRARSAGILTRVLTA